MFVGHVWWIKKFIIKYRYKIFVSYDLMLLIRLAVVVNIEENFFYEFFNNNSF